jgi:hypothetical protein
MTATVLTLVIAALLIVGFLAWCRVQFILARSNLRETWIIEACEAMGLHHPQAKPGAQKAVCQSCGSVETRWHRI